MQIIPMMTSWKCNISKIKTDHIFFIFESARVEWHKFLLHDPTEIDIVWCLENMQKTRATKHGFVIRIKCFSAKSSQTEYMWIH